MQNRWVIAVAVLFATGFAGAQTKPSGTAGVRADAPARRTVPVDSLAALQRAIDDAAAGDRIVMADAVYTTDRPVTVRARGTAENPVVIAAASVGGVQVKGSHGFTFDEAAAYVVVEGFQFLHSNVVMNLPAGTHHLRLTRNVFAYANDARTPYVSVSGDDCEIDHNTFRDKSTEGCMVTVQGPGNDQMAQRTWIHHNLFKNFRPSANNCSAIQVGLSWRSLASGHALVEHNLFVNCRGENEGGICNKSCDNTYRYNTFAERTTELSLRHGNRCQVYGNYFIDTDGLRFFGHDHRIYSNYFERCRAAITIGNGGGIVPQAGLRAHDKPVNCQVVFNTLVDNRVNIQMLNRNRGLGAAGTVVANNVIVGGNQAARIAGPMEQPTWEGNVVWNTSGGAGDIPPGGFVQVDPMLKPRAQRTAGPTTGPYYLERSRPATSAAGAYDYVITDIDGQPRGPRRDAGADQLSDAPAVSRVLTEADVGPAAP